MISIFFVRYQFWHRFLMSVGIHLDFILVAICDAILCFFTICVWWFWGLDFYAFWLKMALANRRASQPFSLLSRPCSPRKCFGSIGSIGYIWHPFGSILIVCDTFSAPFWHQKATFTTRICKAPAEQPHTHTHTPIERTLPHKGHVQNIAAGTLIFSNKLLRETIRVHSSLILDTSTCSRTSG